MALPERLLRATCTCNYWFAICTRYFKWGKGFDIHFYDHANNSHWVPDLRIHQQQEIYDVWYFRDVIIDDSVFVMVK